MSIRLYIYIYIRTLYVHDDVIVPVCTRCVLRCGDKVDSAPAVDAPNSPQNLHKPHNLLQSEGTSAPGASVHPFVHPVSDRARKVG